MKGFLINKALQLYQFINAYTGEDLTYYLSHPLR
jgi:hypothetical protein